MSIFSQICSQLQLNPKVWVVTGVAGFIGSNILETLLKLDQIVVGLDDLSTGKEKNLSEVKSLVTNAQWSRFKLVRGSIVDYAVCFQVVQGADYVLHQAALGSVPRSIADPVSTNQSNITGFLNMLEASRLEGVSNFVYAASSSTYGDSLELPKVEENIGSPLSPYAVTKLVNELYADVYYRVYGFKSTGLRYFNVYGQRQDPAGHYAAVIPKWIGAMINNQSVVINGDGSTSRDFTYVENVVNANILSAIRGGEKHKSVFNVACANEVSLVDLFNAIKTQLVKHDINYSKEAEFRDFRGGDVLHSLANITKAKEVLGYEVVCDFLEGLERTTEYFVTKHRFTNEK
mgnify:CR=1 FL=1